VKTKMLKKRKEVKTKMLKKRKEVKTKTGEIKSKKGEKEKSFFNH
jgi:hypothetical protein